MPAIESKKRANSNSTTGDDRISRKKVSSIITIKQTAEEEAKAKDYFQPHVFDPTFKDDLKTTISNAEPYNWGTILNLMDDELLRNVRKEMMQEIQFTKKETDIYKVFQSGDLANLSALSEDMAKRLPSLYKLRSAIYSQTFRDYISYVTGCGKLSGIKTDMSLNTYIKGCHLLTHDDVIGSRRVSFILYLPDPDKHWKPHYGGSLRLFDSIVPNVPKSDFHSKLTPQFNQIAFFQVQPGLSFHDVEEVKVDKQRMSIQGWFHIPQPGEDGFIPGEQEKTEARSTLQQLESKELKEYDFPKLLYNELPALELKELETTENQEVNDHLKLSDLDTQYLAKFMNPSLLNKDSIERLNNIFTEESVVDVLSFLNTQYESLLKQQMKQYELNSYPPMPQHENELQFPWKLAIPSHKQRYLYIDGLAPQSIETEDSINEMNLITSQEQPNFQLTKQVIELSKTEIPKEQLIENSKSLTSATVDSKLCDLAIFFKSISFKKWLYQVTGLSVFKEQILIRKFRPGHDFILATKLDENTDSSLLDGVLEATLNLTPSQGWESGDLGGYEICMVDGEEENLSADEKNQFNEDEAAIYKSSDKDDSLVYESQACWNKLNLMLRDESVLKFIKYVSFQAIGCRYDISCSWKCKNDYGNEEDENTTDS